MQVHRRDFLRWLSAAVPLGAWGCEAGTTALTPPPRDAGAAGVDTGAMGADAGAAARDADAPPDAAPPDADAVPDGGALVDAGVIDAGEVGEALVIAASFDVVLYDPSCSRHSHNLRVVAGAYPPGSVTRYLGGSHTVALSSNEIAELAGGALIPFTTSGDFPGGHGHCGLAYRGDLPTPTLPEEVICAPVGTAQCIP